LNVIGFGPQRNFAYSYGSIAVLLSVGQPRIREIREIELAIGGLLYSKVNCIYPKVAISFICQKLEKTSMQGIPHPSSPVFGVPPLGRFIRFFGGMSVALACLLLNAAQAQTTNYALGLTNLVVGPTAGSNSVVLGVTPQTAAWTNMANAGWLHFSPANSAGIGSTNVVFSFDGNPGATRTGTLTIGEQTVAVTQAGSTYVAAQGMTMLASSGLNDPNGVAVDKAGNVYIADTYNSAITEWIVTNNAQTTLISSNLSQPRGVAVDGSGNVYIADSGDNAIKEWTVANSNLTTLAAGIAVQIEYPRELAVDASGNVYFADSPDNSIGEWTAANSNLITLASSGIAYAYDVAVDAAGNVYVADYDRHVIDEWMAATSNLITLPIPLGINGAGPVALAVDGSGNIYTLQYFSLPPFTTVIKWSAANASMTPLTSFASATAQNGGGIAVDSSGNVYFTQIANTSANISNGLQELPCAFVDQSGKLESNGAGNDSLSAVLPTTENLLPPFAPASSQPWLTITGITNGVVSFSFTSNSGPNRMANILLLGQNIPIVQGGPIFSLGTTALLEGPGAGSDSVILTVMPATSPWTNMANVPWLHLVAPSLTGTGSANVVFSFDANPGATRAGTLTVGDQTLTVTQAGSTYVAASAVTTLVSSGLEEPSQLAMDKAGNVYIAAYSGLTEWEVANKTLYSVPNTAGNQFGYGLVAVDDSNNVYFDSSSRWIMEWTAANSNMTALFPWNSQFSQFLSGLAVDGIGNVYVAIENQSSAGTVGVINKWTAANNTVSTLASVSGPITTVAVDGLGNVYFNDYINLNKWTAANNTVTALTPSTFGTSQPFVDTAVDGSGNVYFGSGGIYKWTAFNSNVTTVASLSGASFPLAVDRQENLYTMSVRSGQVYEIPYAFVDSTARVESSAGAFDALPAVVPASAALLSPAPASDQTWLTIQGVTNGVVSFSVAANPGLPRTAHITLLGQIIPIVQVSLGPPEILTALPMQPGGPIQFAFGSATNTSFTVLTTTNLSIPLSNWTVAGTASNTAPELFQFSSQPTTNNVQQFYKIRSP